MIFFQLQWLLNIAYTQDTAMTLTVLRGPRSAVRWCKQQRNQDLSHICFTLSISQHTATMSIKNLAPIALRGARAAISQAPRARLTRFGARPQPTALRSQTPVTTRITHQRFHSSDNVPKDAVWDFERIKELTEKPDEDRILIGTLFPPILFPFPCRPLVALLTMCVATDVREPAEFEAGYIPTAVNIPVGSSPDALFMPAHEFEDKFGFEKPRQEQELVFYCKAGVRSSAAAQLARQVGYGKVGEYRGSWIEWTNKGGKKEFD